MNSATEITFRPAGLGDIPLLQTLADRIWRTAYREMISEAQINYMLGWMYAPECLAREMADGVKYELAELAGQSVGYLALSCDPATCRAELHKLYLASEWHGRGFGQVLLRHALELARKLGAERVGLRVNRRNARAIRAYERAGFRRECELCEDIGGGFLMDDWVMLRRLTEPS